MTRFYFWFFLGLFLTGCASEPPAPALPPTVVKLQIISSSDVNSGNNGEASPVILRIFELKDSSSFNSADFFALFNDDKAILGSDLGHKSELTLKPGDSKALELQPSEDAQSIGLFAAFRQLDNAQWRTSVKIEPHQTQLVMVKLERNQLRIELPH